MGARAMNTRLFTLLAALVFCAAGVVQAQLETVKISVARTQKDQSKDGKGVVTVVTKEIAYRINVLNKTFKPLADVEVKYLIFYEDAKPGATTAPVVASHAGSEKFISIEANRNVEFDTTTFQLSQSDLSGNYFYESGGSNRAKDRVVGVWIKVFSAGKEVGEYANPVSILKKQTWRN